MFQIEKKVINMTLLPIIVAIAMHIPGVVTAQEAPDFINPTDGTVTSEFGIRTDPHTGEPGDLHRGMDIANTAGTPIVAPADGTVVRVGLNDPISGNWLRINHGNGWETTYAHLQEVNITALDENGNPTSRVGWALPTKER